MVSHGITFTKCDNTVSFEDLFNCQPANKELIPMVGMAYTHISKPETKHSPYFVLMLLIQQGPHIVIPFSHTQTKLFGWECKSKPKITKTMLPLMIT